VPFVDLKAAYAEIEAELQPVLHDIMARGAFILGPELVEFESAFAGYCEAEACAGVENGTTALSLALKVQGIGAGDEVVVPANTFAATAAAVMHTGASVVFADVDPVTLTLDAASFEAAIGPATRAVIPVHLYGQAADMKAINAVARAADLKVVEDAAQAHGARYNGRRVGSLAELAGFSFYPSKNLGAFGDGGAVVGSDAELVERVRIIRNHGQSAKNVHSELGDTARLDNLHAAVLATKLRALDQRNAARRRIAAAYEERLADQSSWLELPQTGEGREHVWHLYVVHLDNRDALAEKLMAANIGYGMHYPIALHDQPAFADARIGGPLKVCEKSAARLLSLPMFPEMSDDQIDAVVSAVRGFGGG